MIIHAGVCHYHHSNNKGAVYSYCHRHPYWHLQYWENQSIPLHIQEFNSNSNCCCYSNSSCCCYLLLMHARKKCLIRKVHTHRDN